MGSDIPQQRQLLGQVIRHRLEVCNLSIRQASLRANLSHNTLRVVLAGARPSIETCDALDPVLGLPAGTLRLLSGWPLQEQEYAYSRKWAQTLLEIAGVEDRQRVIGYLLAQRTNAILLDKEQHAG
jgi:hypothetical protein